MNNTPDFFTPSPSQLVVGLMGTIMAMLISWDMYHSVLWAIINGLFGWAYVIYWALFLR